MLMSFIEAKAGTLASLRLESDKITPNYHYIRARDVSLIADTLVKSP